jgi:hypothetical protein
VSTGANNYVACFTCSDNIVAFSGTVYFVIIGICSAFWDGKGIAIPFSTSVGDVLPVFLRGSSVSVQVRAVSSCRGGKLQYQ